MVMMLLCCRRLVLVLEHELIVFLLKKAAHFNLVVIKTRRNLLELRVEVWNLVFLLLLLPIIGAILR